MGTMRIGVVLNLSVLINSLPKVTVLFHKLLVSSLALFKIVELGSSADVVLVLIVALVRMLLKDAHK
jgi:hypothetical protein